MSKRQRWFSCIGCFIGCCIGLFGSSALLDAIQMFPIVVICTAIGGAVFGLIGYGLGSLGMRVPDGPINVPWLQMPPEYFRDLDREDGIVDIRAAVELEEPKDKERR